MKRVVTVPADVTLAALSTEVPERTYSFAAFVVEWVLHAPAMREDENLPHLFALEESLSSREPAKAGEELAFEDGLWSTMKTVAKRGIDDAMTPDAQGRQRLPSPWAFKVLRLYHALAKAEQKNEA